MIADFHDAMEEAERTRTLSLMGIRELAGLYEREVARRDASSPGIERETAQTYWARSEMAKADIEAGSPGINAQALISMNSVLDAMVEQLSTSWREAIVAIESDRIFEKATTEHPEAAAKIDDATMQMLRQAIRSELDRQLPKPGRLTGSGAKRYETVLAKIGWGAPADRPIPPDMDLALAEFGAIRDVLIHRAGRVDSKALEQAPSLRYQEGQLIRVSADDFRTYSAAIRCYAMEVQFRPMRNWPEVSESDGPDLARWRDYRILGT